MIALGIDPGSRGNCGWALVEYLELPGETVRRVLCAGIVRKDGQEIEEVLFGLGEQVVELVAFERPMGHFYNVSVALNRIVGRWLGAVEASHLRGARVVEVQASQWQPNYGTYKPPKTTDRKRKDAAKAIYQDGYRRQAVALLGLDPKLQADAAAAAWVACYAIEHARDRPARKKRRKRR